MKYGVTRDFVQGLEAVLPNGEVINVGGKLVKNSTAYSLLDIIIGSEGTLAIVTKAILRLVPKPQYTALLYVPFESTKDAARTVSEIVRRKVVPFALEYIPRHAILIAEKYLDRPLPDNSHPAYLLIGIEGNSKAEVEENLETAGEVCLEMGGVDAFVADTAQKQDQLWEARKCLFDAYKAYWEIDEVDACVPRNRIPDYIEGAERVAQEKGVIITNIGHAGDGNVHSLIAMEKHSSEDWHTTLDAIIGDLIDIALNLGGTISGEHGLGLAKKRYLARQVGETQVELMRAIKRGFDPHNILNPGKVFDIV